MRKITVSVFASVFLFLLFAGYVFAEPGDAIKNLFEDKCSFCHDMSRPLSKIKNREDWMSTVKRMQAKMPDHIKDEEMENIVNYLAYVKGEDSEKINQIKDMLNLTESEKKHIPVIEISNEDKENKTAIITVKVGEIIHPMVEDHYIKYIELFTNYKSVQKILLNPMESPEVIFAVKFSRNDHVSAREECNIHGLWENSGTKILAEETIKASR